MTFKKIGKEEEFIPIDKVENNKFIVSFDKHVYTINDDNEKIYEWTSFVYDNEKNSKSILDIIYELIDNDVKFRIKNSFSWNNYIVYLSTENQMNYKAAFDLAVTTNGESLPVTFRFYKRKNAELYTFDTLSELKEFYIKMNSHINNSLLEGWNRKDSINKEDYKI